MQRGFSDVGYLFVPHVCSFRPAMISRRVWRRRDHEPEESRLQPGLQQNDEGMLGGLGVLGLVSVGCGTGLRLLSGRVVVSAGKPFIN